MSEHHSTYAPSMASTAYSDDDNDDQTSQVLAEIQKLESILLEQLDKETRRFGSSSNSNINSNSSFDRHGIVGDISSPSIGTTNSDSDSDIDIDLDGASSINFSQFLDAQDSHSHVSSTAAPSSVNWAQIDAITSLSSSSSSAAAAASSNRIKDFDEASDLLDNQSCTSLRKELSQVVTPYGHVSQRVQTYEELNPAVTTATGNPQFAVSDETETSLQEAGGAMYQKGASLFAGTADGSVMGSSVTASATPSSGMEELNQRTAAMMSTVENDRQSTTSLATSHASHPTEQHQQQPHPQQHQQQHQQHQHQYQHQQHQHQHQHQHQNNIEEQDQAALLSQTQKIKSLLQNLESQLNHVTVAASKGLQNATTTTATATTATASKSTYSSIVPSLEIRNSIRSLNFLEDSLRKNSPFGPSGTNTIQEEEEEADEDGQSSSTASSSAYVTHSRNRLNNIRQKLWGGANNNKMRQPEANGDFAGVQDDDVDNASVVGQVSTDIQYHHHHHQQSPIREETTCFPKAADEQQPLRPRDDYFSAAYQNAFACNSAYQLDVPEPGSSGGVSSTPNDSGGKNYYYYYYPPPETMGNNLPNVAAACCKIPPMEQLMTVLKRLEVKVASCHVNHLQKRRHRQGQQQPQRQGHRFPDGAVLQQYELADLDLSNPSRAERYHDL